MTILYPIIAAIVTCLLLSILLFPYFKTWRRLKSHHNALWDGLGPFDIVSLLSYAETQKNFFKIINTADIYEDLKTNDPELIKWARVSREVTRMMPRSFVYQVFYICLFIFFVCSFTSQILAWVS